MRGMRATGEPMGAADHHETQIAPQVDPRQRKLLIALRRAILIFLVELEEYMGVERSVPTADERRQLQRLRDRAA